MKASVVAALISDTNKVARRLLQLKQIFPGANVSRLATRFPALVMVSDSSFILSGTNVSEGDLS